MIIEKRHLHGVLGCFSVMDGVTRQVPTGYAEVLFANKQEEHCSSALRCTIEDRRRIDQLMDHGYLNLGLGGLEMVLGGVVLVRSLRAHFRRNRTIF